LFFVYSMTNEQQIAFMPSGKPCPVVLTAGEVVELLRLDGNGERTLKYYRDEGELVGFRLGRKVRYRLADVMAFLAKKAGVSACVADGKRGF
jgi:hypothetical protein